MMRFATGNIASCSNGLQRWNAIAAIAALVSAATSGTVVVQAAAIAQAEDAPFAQRPSTSSRFTAVAKDVVTDVFRTAAFGYHVDTARGGGFIFSHQLKLEELRCSDVQKFVMTRNSGLAGELSVGRCADDDAEKVKRIAHAAQDDLDASINALKSAGARMREDIQPPRHVKTAGPSGSEIHTFPVIWISHGMGILETAVLIPKSGTYAYLVQADINGSCTVATPEQSKFCVDVSKAITDIVRRMHQRYSW